MQAFSRQTDLQHGYLPISDAEEQTISGALKGTYTADEALRMLLPAGFTYEWVDERSLSIISPPIRTLPKPEIESVAKSASTLHDVIDRVWVTDSRLWSLEPEFPSLIVLDRSDIEALGVSTAAEILEYLPQQPYSSSAGFRVSGEQYADLRGLGPDMTLVLINGRRVTTSATSFDSNAFDLNTIPLTAVERIEVLTDEISVAAGADSIGGVINFVLKEHFRSPLLEVRYGAAAGGAEELRLSLGGEQYTQTLHVSAIVDYLRRHELPGAERDLWRDQDYRRFGSADLRSPDANPGTVTSATAENLPGLSARYAAIPRHDLGSSLTRVDFVDTIGQRNLESSYQYRSILPQTDRLSIVSAARAMLSRNDDAFAELLYTDRTSVLRDLPVTLSGVLVPASNPFNPFEVPVLVNMRMSGIGEHLQSTEARFVRAVFGLRHKGPNWTAEASVQHIEDSASLTTQNELDPTRLAAALAQTDPALALDAFADGPAAAGDVLATLLASPTVRDYTSRETLLSAVLRGQPLALPAGSVSFLLGAQWRQPYIQVDSLAHGTAQRSIASGFVDLRLPLVGQKMRVRGVADLTLTLSSRLDRYSDTGAAWNSHGALAWRPVTPLTLRATYGTSFRAPSLYERYQPTISFPFALSDPKRNNEVSSLMVFFGGNPELEETTARSWSFGLTFKEPHLADLQMTLNGWQVEIQNRVATITLPALFAHEELYGDRVMRAMPSEADITAGLPGRLTALDLTPANVGRLKARGVDAGLSFGIDTRVGRLTPGISMTWMDSFTAVDLPGTEPVERVGKASAFGTIPRWRAVARLGWNQGVLSAFTGVRFLSRYDDVNLLQNRLNGRVIHSQALVDVQASLDLDTLLPTGGLGDGLRLTTGINNLFDEGPQFAEIGATFGYDVTQGDLRGRFGYLRLTKRF